MKRKMDSSGATGEAFQSTRVLDVELSQPLPFLSAVDEQTGRRYERVQALVRLHGRPMGVVELQVEGDGVSAAACASEIWRTCQVPVNEHLRRDGLPARTRLDEAGLGDLSVPACLQERARVLAHAPFVSVVVPTRDRAAQLAMTLPTLMTLDYPQYEVIVVDNAPQTSATAELLARYAGRTPSIRYVREDRPGLSWARNCGLEHARGEMVAFLDDDELTDPQWLAAMVQGFELSDQVACVTGLTLAAELETEAQLYLEQFGGFHKGRAFKPLLFDLDEHRPPDPLFPYLASVFGAGGNAAFRTQVLRDLGGFDPALGAGTPAGAAEDLAAFFQVIVAGYALLYEPAALLRHFHRRDYPGVRKQLYGYGKGFTAYLTKSLLERPQRILELLGKLPAALSYLCSPRSPRNALKRVDYPRDLTRVELQGMLYGPWGYLQSRWQMRRIRQEFGLPEVQKP